MESPEDRRLRGFLAEPPLGIRGLTAAEEEPVYRPAPVKRPKAESASSGGGATMLDALFSTKQAKDQFKAMVLEVLRSPEGQEVIAQAVWKELAKRR